MIATAERRSFVMKLRKSGWTYEKIALAAIRKYGRLALPRGYDVRYAYKDVKRELDKLRSETSEDTEAVRDIELQRLDALLSGIWAKAARGNVAAIDRALRISERRCKLLGVDAPTKSELTGKGGGPMEIAAVMDADTRDRSISALAATIAASLHPES